MKEKQINVAVITGGPQEERGISLKSSKLIIESLTDPRLKVYIVDIQEHRWIETTMNVEVDKNDFSILVNGEKVRFDIAYLILHGTPAEDGKLQGYLDMVKVPYTGCDTFVSALTFNKIASKNFLRAYDVDIAQSVNLSYNSLEEFDPLSLPVEAIEKLNYPLFVKPNRAGSSYGVHKVKNREQLIPAIRDALLYDREILIEEFLDGREFSCGVIPHKGDIYALPVTELIPDGEFFDFAAKYEGKSVEVTPADLTMEQEKNCRSLSEKLYRILSCEGIVRFDYILSRGKFYFLEVNTIPGLTVTSIVPQGIRAEGLDVHEVLQSVLLDKLTE